LIWLCGAAGGKRLLNILFRRQTLALYRIEQVKA
jgi:hypothetical protein